MIGLRSALLVTVLASFAMACETGVMGRDYGQVPEESYDLLAVTTGPCAPKAGVNIDPKHEAACKQMTEPRRYRGTWYVDFETSYFTPIGRKYCRETSELGDCVELTGEALPWPRRSDCTQEYQIEFVGRRNLLPHNYIGSAYRIIVDKVLSVKRMPNPARGLGECTSATP